MIFYQLSTLVFDQAELPVTLHVTEADTSPSSYHVILLLEERPGSEV